MNHMIDGDMGDSFSSPLNSSEDCPECDGSGTVIYSCCGDDITHKVNSTGDDICPTCKEHCGDETEDCTTCEGFGILPRDVAEAYRKKKKNQ